MPRSYHSPAFQLYPNEWLGSTKIMLMTPAEEGAYFRLLCIAWNSPDCSLPDDDEHLSVLSRLGQDWLNGSGEKIRENFVSRRGKLFNKRLLKEREKQEEWREKCREGGIKSGKSRKNKAKEAEGCLKGSSTKGPTKCELNTNSSSSSSSLSSSLKKKEKEDKENSTPPENGFLTLGEFQNIRLKQAEVEKLNSEYGEQRAAEMVEILSSAMAANKKLQKKYSNHYATIRTWERSGYMEGKKRGMLV